MTAEEISNESPEADNWVPNPIYPAFVAGTMVHTADGLRPIESIRTGDMVLSRYSKESDPIYRRVIRTFVEEDEELLTVDFSTATEMRSLVVTGDHLFWVKDLEWINAEQLQVGATLPLLDGSEATVFNVTPVMQTSEKNVGWIRGGWGVYDPNEEFGRIIDLRDDKVSIEFDAAKKVTYDDVGPPDMERMVARIFNIEVEESLTYFVSDLGILVLC